MLFLSEITFLLEHQMFAMDEHVFMEGFPGDKIYFVNKGRLATHHKSTSTFIGEIEVN